VSRATIHALYQEYLQCLERVTEQDKTLKQIIREHPLLSQLIRLRGVGPVTAVALYASVGKGEQFANARQLAAWIGLVPRQHGTGGRIRLGAISKRGNRYLRELLVHGARAVMQWAKEKLDGLSGWVRQLAERRGKHKTIVAIANKTARMVWVLLNRGIANVPAHYLKAA
jgi:transposase